jgi:hypothetical protein
MSFNVDIDILDGLRAQFPAAVEMTEDALTRAAIKILRDCKSRNQSRGIARIEFARTYYDIACVARVLAAEVASTGLQALGENTVKITKNELREMIFSELLNERGGPIDWAEDRLEDLGDWKDDRVEDVRDWVDDEILEPTRDAICDISDEAMRDWRRDIERWIRRNADDLAEMCPWGTQWACEELIEESADEIARCMVAAMTPDMCRTD